MTIEIARPDDWHVHLRDGAMLARVVPETARRFSRAIVMPNLDTPDLTTDDARAYRARILAALPEGADFEPLMTLYLSPQTTPAEIDRAADSGIVFGVKLYPKGATTNAGAGVDRLDTLEPVLAAMERRDLPLLVHAESTAPDCDVFDREEAFLEAWLVPTIERFEGLRVVFEHITTRVGAEFVRGRVKTGRAVWWTGRNSLQGVRAFSKEICPGALPLTMRTCFRTSAHCSLDFFLRNQAFAAWKGSRLLGCKLKVRFAMAKTK